MIVEIMTLISQQHYDRFRLRPGWILSIDHLSIAIEAGIITRDCNGNVKRF
jgi:hypothetical protein